MINEAYMPVYERSRVKIFLVCAQTNGLTEVFHEALVDLKTVGKRWRLEVMAIRGEN